MKNLFYFSVGTILLGIATDFCHAQSAQSSASVPAPTPPAIIARDANSCVWEWTDYEQGVNGQFVPKVHQYTELASGLSYQQNGQWVASQEQINILPDGSAASTNGQYAVYYPPDIYNGSIRLVGADGVELQSEPVALMFSDGTNSAIIAVLTNSVGELISSNQIIYTNAFFGVQADLLYTYQEGGFEQDVILHQQPPTLESLGVNSQTACLQVLTEFINSPSPIVNSITVSTAAGEMTDDSLDFGATKMVPGRAFLLGTNEPDVRVTKQWLTEDGRQFLVESVPVASVADDLNNLPPPATQVTRRFKKHNKLASARLAKGINRASAYHGFQFLT
jgi:hypothetical protein